MFFNTTTRHSFIFPKVRVRVCSPRSEYNNIVFIGYTFFPTEKKGVKNLKQKSVCIKKKNWGKIRKYIQPARASENKNVY